MGNLENYNQVMRDSSLRLAALESLLDRIVNLCKNKTLKESVLNRIEKVLRDYEVEDGVTVFCIPPIKPKNKKLIDKIDIGKDFMLLWWGENLNLKNKANFNKYALGITFIRKGPSDLISYTIEELVEDFPEFKEFFCLRMKAGDKFKMIVYSSAGAFYKACRSAEGEWLIQTPVHGCFVPNRPIGKFGNNELHIFRPGKDIKVEKYERFIEVV